MSLIALFWIADSAVVSLALDRIEGFGYIGMFIAGMFSVSAFTVVPATLVLLTFAHDFSIVLVALTAALGSVAGDLFLFRFFRNGVLEELTPLFRRAGGAKFMKVLRHRRLSWLAILFGAFIIASPLPDEVGIGLMGISTISTLRFALLSFVLNTIGIMIILQTVRAVAG